MAIAKSIPTLTKEIRKIKLETPKGSKLWCSKVETFGSKTHVTVEMANAKLTEIPGWDVDHLRQQLKGKLGEIILPGYKTPIVAEIFDNYL